MCAYYRISSEVYCYSMPSFFLLLKKCVFSYSYLEECFAKIMFTTIFETFCSICRAVLALECLYCWCELTSEGRRPSLVFPRFNFGFLGYRINNVVRVPAHETLSRRWLKTYLKIKSLWLAVQIVITKNSTPYLRRNDVIRVKLFLNSSKDLKLYARFFWKF